jgi:hypothetical protein
MRAMAFVAVMVIGLSGCTVPSGRQSDNVVTVTQTVTASQPPSTTSGPLLTAFLINVYEDDSDDRTKGTLVLRNRVDTPLRLDEPWTTTYEDGWVGWALRSCDSQVALKDEVLYCQMTYLTREIPMIRLQGSTQNHGSFNATELDADEVEALHPGIALSRDDQAGKLVTASARPGASWQGMQAKITFSSMLTLRGAKTNLLQDNWVSFGPNSPVSVGDELAFCAGSSGNPNPISVSFRYADGIPLGMYTFSKGLFNCQS